MMKNGNKKIYAFKSKNTNAHLNLLNLNLKYFVLYLSAIGLSSTAEEMGKGDDAIAKKRNKGIRKRMRKDLATSSPHVNGIIAAKRRKKDQTRRMCRVSTCTSFHFLL